MRLSTLAKVIPFGHRRTCLRAITHRQDAPQLMMVVAGDALFGRSGPRPSMAGLCFSGHEPPDSAPGSEVLMTIGPGAWNLEGSHHCRFTTLPQPARNPD